MARVLGQRRGQREKRAHGDLSLFSGVTARESKFKVDMMPGQHAQRSGKLSQYGKQFRAKQIARHFYGILERQFRRYFENALHKKGATGEHLLRQLECRLDNVVYRMGFGRTRQEARQLVSHRSIIVKRGDKQRIVNIASFEVRPNDEIFIKEQSQKQGRLQEAIELVKQRTVPDWLEVDWDAFKGKIKRIPERSDMPLEIDELMIVEFYSK